jgi:hypothetical protein
MIRVEQPPQLDPIGLGSVRAGVRLTPGVGPRLASLGICRKAEWTTFVQGWLGTAADAVGPSGRNSENLNFAANRPLRGERLPHLVNWLTFRRILLHRRRGHRRCHRDRRRWCGDVRHEGTAAGEATRETWSEADIHRTAGEIALMSSEPDAVKAQAHFERGLEIARAQQAPSWGLRAATCLAGSGAIRAGGGRPITSSRLSTAGSLRASTRST